MTMISQSFSKHEQIVVVADAVTVAPQQSAPQLRRNLQLAESPTKHIEPLRLRCMQRVVHAARAQLTVKQPRQGASSQVR
jgi:hypothetical protein